MDIIHLSCAMRSGAVTLCGPVKTAAGLEQINVLVKAMPDIKSIDNQLQVK